MLFLTNTVDTELNGVNDFFANNLVFSTDCQLEFTDDPLGKYWTLIRIQSEYQPMGI